MKYICLIYDDEQELAALSDEALTEHIGKCADWVKELKAVGRYVYSEGLSSVRTATTVRIRNGSVCVADGPFEETKEVLDGFTIIEARDLSEAVQLASKLDCTRFGSVEVRPLIDLEIEPTNPFDRRVVSAARRVFNDQK
jgi:hypothetical protein